jgi:hypothetical protein
MLKNIITLPQRAFERFIDFLAELLGTKLSRAEDQKDLPKPITDRYTKLLIIALVIAVLSALGIAVFTHTGLEALETAPFPIILVAAIIVYAKYYIWTIRKHGFATRIGISLGAYEGRDASMFTDRPFGLVKKQVIGTLVDVDGYYYLLPQPKDNLIIPEGRAVAIYAEPGDTYFEINGVRRFSAIYGFEIVPVPEETFGT